MSEDRGWRTDHRVSLDGQVAIVTGGARGIGRAYAQGLASAGAAVVIADLREEEGSQAATAIGAAGGRAMFVATDVTDQVSTADLAAAADEEFGGVDILVNNAAVFAGLSRAPLTELPVERWRRVMDVNVTGAWLCMRAAAVSSSDRCHA
jgi:NAD(P)-dependent dehydrogenase (short-subunit alcohol dehydrogenase family)